MIFNESNVVAVLKRELGLSQSHSISFSEVLVSEKTSSFAVPTIPTAFDFVIWIPGQTTVFKGRIFKDEEVATAYYVKVVREWLSAGEFFKKVKVEPSVYVELMKVANTRGLRNFLEVVYSSGLIANPKECPLFNLSSEKTKMTKNENIGSSIPQEKYLFKQQFAGELEERMLYWLCRYYNNEPEAIIAAILDYCTFVGDELEQSIIRGFGGWVSLCEYTITAETDEGFVFEPTSEETEAFMHDLQKRQKQSAECEEMFP